MRFPGNHVEAFLLQSCTGVAQTGEPLGEAGPGAREPRGLGAGEGKFVASNALGLGHLVRRGLARSLRGIGGEQERVRGAADVQRLDQAGVLVRTDEFEGTGTVDQFLRIAGFEAGAKVPSGPPC